MSELQFVVAGRLVDREQLIAQAEKRPPKPRETAKPTADRASATKSLGFVVLGYSPADLARREKDFTHECEQRKARAAIASDRAEFDAKWLARNKPRRVRQRPYELPAGADAAADLARKAGWFDVNVQELLLA